MRRAALLVAVVPRVESAKHRHGELVVVAMALGDDHAVLVDALDDAVHAPREGLVGAPRPRHHAGRPPTGGEQRTAVAQILSGAGDPAAGQAAFMYDASEWRRGGTRYARTWRRR